MLNSNITTEGSVERLAVGVAAMQAQPDCLSVWRTTVLGAF